MKDAVQSVLCFPRTYIAECERFTPWSSACELLQSAEQSMTWLPRTEAEVSETLIQPIPCTLVVSETQSYHVFRRIKEGRPDLRSRISLVIGGHIDHDVHEDDFSSLAMGTLMREIDEELKVEWLSSDPKPVGLVIDQSSLESSRHAAIVYELVVGGRIKPKAVEEFSIHSKYDGKPCTPNELLSLRKAFDPWSMIIFGDYINPSYSQDVGKQLSFLSLR